MRVLLDENVPHDLIAALSGHDIVTVQGLGWAGTLNGELLARASGSIDAFITLDRKLEREHQISLLSFGVIVLSALMFVAALFALVSGWLLLAQGHGPSIQLGLLAGAIAFVTWAAGYLLPSGQGRE